MRAAIACRRLIALPGMVLGLAALAAVAAIPAAATAGTAGSANAGSDGSAQLLAEPSFNDLGRYSIEDPLRSECPPGRTSFQILSVTPWYLEMVMQDPLRRLGDGYELSLERASRVSPLIPKEIVDREPFVVASGDGAAQWQEVAVDWQTVHTLVQEYLQASDPPGVYGGTLLLRLAGPTGLPLTEWEKVTIRFEVAGYAGLPQGVPDIELQTVGPAGGAGHVELESEVTPLVLAGNAPWELSVRGTAELVRVDGEDVVPLARLSLAVPRELITDDVQSLAVDFRTLGESEIAIARGMGSGTSASPELVVPLILRLETDQPVEAGRYHTTLMFEVRSLISR